MDFDFSSAASFVSAVAAAISAAIAYRANHNLAKADRKRCLREVSLLANKINTAATGANDLSEHLKLAYQGLFIITGRGGSSTLNQIVEDIENKRETLTPMKNAARRLLEDDLETLSDEQITEHLLKFDGHLVHIERIRRQFDTELASVEAKHSLERQIKTP